jgi:hypothetical protein
MRQHFQPSSAQRAAGALLLLSLVAAGCSTKVEVSGKVSYQGRPVVGVIAFLPSAGGSFSAPIDPDGAYRISGLPTGPAKITVKPPAPLAPFMLKEREKWQADPNHRIYSDQELAKMPERWRAVYQPDPDPKHRPPIIYGDPKTTPLEITITQGEQVHEIELK